MSDDELLEQVRRGVVSVQFYERYKTHIEAKRAAAREHVTELIGSAGSRLAARAERAVLCETFDELARSLRQMPADARERFARRVLTHG